MDKDIAIQNSVNTFVILMVLFTIAPIIIKLSIDYFIKKLKNDR